MRKKRIFNAALLLLLTLSFGCRQQGKTVSMAAGSEKLVIDSSLAVLLQPTQQEVVSSLPAIKALSGPRLFTLKLDGRMEFSEREQKLISSRVAGRIESLAAHVDYQSVHKGQLLIELYAPELLAGQRDFLQALSDPLAGPSLSQAARQRLLQLGMPAATLERLESSRQVQARIGIYSPADGVLTSQTLEKGNRQQRQLLRLGDYVQAGQPLFYLHSGAARTAELAVPNDLLPHIRKNDKLLLQLQGDSALYPARIDLIVPEINAPDRFSSIRSYLSGERFYPGQLVSAYLPIWIEKGSWLPKTAIWQTGMRSLVFVKQQGVFLPRAIDTGLEYQGWVQVLSPLEGLEIASNAYFLVDSESFIRPLEGGSGE